MTFRKTTSLCLALLMVGSTAFADANMDQLVKSKFSGKGKILNVFGGKAAKDGLEIRTAVSGDRKATKTGKNVEVVDLAQQKIWRYRVNRKGKAKKCQATTFDEFREQLAAMKELPFFGDGEKPAEEAGETSPAPEYEVTVTLTETGEQEMRAGMTGKVYQFKAIAHREGLPVEEGGGILDTTFVIGEKTAEWTELQAWNERWGELIGEMTGMGDNLVKTLAGSPALQKAMAEFRSKESEMDGTMLRVSMRLSTVSDPRVQEQAEAEDGAESEDVPTSLGGLGAKLGGGLLKKKQADSAGSGPTELYSNEVVLVSLSENTDPLLALPDACTR